MAHHRRTSDAMAPHLHSEALHDAPTAPLDLDTDLAHIQQLAQIDTTSSQGAAELQMASFGIPAPRTQSSFFLKILLQVLVQIVNLINTIFGVLLILYQIYLRFCVWRWIRKNPAVIRAAKDTQCTSSSPASPNWNAVFFSIIESAAMYLRRDTEVALAARAAQMGDHAGALLHLKRSQQDIDAIADALGCRFIQLCDFVRETPDGHPLLSGAFCGAFIKKDTDNPLIGVAFKGTSSFIEAITDLAWRPVEPRGDIAWGSKMHKGFYYGLFGDFQKGRQSAFDLLVDQLALAQRRHDVEDARLHFTGHSLGGAYCTLAYAEFLRRQDEPMFKRFNFGDMYNLGAPRVCLLPFADEVDRLTLVGSGKYSFRIANQDDPIPMMPPPPYWLGNQYPYVHAPGGWKITRRGPRRMADEPPSVTRFGLLRAVFNMPRHMLDSYYARWRRTAHA